MNLKFRDLVRVKIGASPVQSLRGHVEPGEPGPEREQPDLHPPGRLSHPRGS
jgi:hypothetical protein